MTEAYRELLTLAARIPAPPATDGGAAQQQLDAACAGHIHEMLRDGGDPAEIIAFLNADLDALAAAPGADPRATQRVREALLARFDIQARKNATRRRILVSIPFAILAVILLAYFTLKFVNIVGINDPVDTREGMTQRAAAVRKILYYESWKIGEIPNSRARTFFWLALWPWEPTDNEVDGATELVTLMVDTNRDLATREGCDMAISSFGEVNQVGAELFAGRIAAALVSKDMKWEGTPRDSLRTVVRTSQCMPRAAIEALVPK